MIPRFQFFRFLLLLSALLAIAAMDPPSQPIVLSPEQAAKEGRALVDEMLSMKPEENASTTGKMTIRTERPKKFTQIPIKFYTVLTPTNWLSVYEATEPEGTRKLTITHNGKNPGVYEMSFRSTNSIADVKLGQSSTSNNVEMLPFAGSDFSLGDLGLEFLHWPEQRLTQKEMKRSRSCRVLESINPHPIKGGYSKIKSWVDAQSDGIVYALAYDVNGNELKEFIPKDFTKVNGQWQLEEMQIGNLQTKSTTTVKFDLKQ
jgi:hypothetical protein